MFQKEKVACRKARARISALALNADEDQVVEVGLTALLLQGEWTCLDTAIDQAIDIIVMGKKAA